MKIVVIGKSGQLASEIARLKVPQIKCVFLGRNDIDLLNTTNILNKLTELGANAVINAAAYTAVDRAESDQKNVFNINHIAVENLANCCKTLAIHLVQVSTDFVFNGRNCTPYCVDDTKDPKSVYGQSKANAEDALLAQYQQNSCIIRTSWVYSSFGNNFVKTIIRLHSQKDKLSIIADQVGSPSCAKSLARACLHASTNGLKGTFHWTDLGVASWYDFAVAIQELALSHNILNKAIPINPIRTTDYPTAAQRPPYSVLDKTGNSVTFSGVSVHHWRTSLNNMLANYAKDQHE